VIASLIETCKLTDVIARIVEGRPNSRLDERLTIRYVGGGNVIEELMLCPAGR